MGIKRYVLLTLVYMLGIGLYVYSFNGESYTFEDAPKQIYDTLNRYRLARVGGKIYEVEKKQT